MAAVIYNRSHRFLQENNKRMELLNLSGATCWIW